MSWRLAESLKVLRDQVNLAAPLRSKISDGTIGDARHSRAASDHNPWVPGGVVTAIDLTHDPKGGFDAWAWAETLRTANDPRVKYVISKGRIWNRLKSNDWRQYYGVNKHVAHTHLSVRSEKRFYDAKDPWVLHLPVADIPKGQLVRAILKFGSKGGDVFELQRLLNVRQPGSVKVDGDFGPLTEAALKTFQEGTGLATDGIAGLKTWQALGVKQP